ncbi:neutral zinc metallopeptidase [Mycolicibacterium fortuitum]
MYSRALVVGEQSAEGLELSRRSELQAQCFSGMFVGSVIDTGGRLTVADYQIALGDNAKRGDWDSNLPRSHGTSEHSGSWWDQGYRLNKIGECNTWLSPPSDVS